MDRPKRKPQVRIKVFTEGTTEYNYISLFGRDTPSVTIDKPVIFIMVPLSRPLSQNLS